MRYYLYNVDTQKIQQSSTVKENDDNTLVDESGDIYKILNRQKKMNVVKYNVQLQERCQVGGMKSTSISESYQKFLNSLPEEDRQGFIDLLTGQPDIDKDIMMSDFVNPIIRKAFIDSGIKDSKPVEDIATLFEEDRENNIDYTQISEAQQKITEKYFKMSPQDLNDVKNNSLIHQYKQIRDSGNDLFDGTEENNNQTVTSQTIIDEYDMDGNVIEPANVPTEQPSLEGAKRKTKRRLYDQLYNFKVQLNDNFLASGRDVFSVKLQRVRQNYTSEDQEKLSYFYRQKKKMLHQCNCDQPLQENQVQKYSGGNNPVDGIVQQDINQQNNIPQEINQQDFDNQDDNENSMSTIASDLSSETSSESSQEEDSPTSSPESDISQGIDPEMNGGKKKSRKRNYLPSDDSDGVEYY